MAESLAAIVESSDHPLLRKTPDGVVTSWNAAAEHMYGYAAAEVVGHSVLVIFPPDRRDELWGASWARYGGVSGSRTT